MNDAINNHAKPQFAGRMIRPNRTIRILIGIAIFWLLINFGYRGIINYRVAQAESRIAWNAAGIHPAADVIDIGQGPRAILLVHGINDTPEVWDRFAPRLAEKGFHVRALRLPGFGEKVERYSAYTRHDWIQSVVDELKSLKKSSQEVTLVGHSLGGAVSLGAIRSAPDAADRLVLLAPGIGVANDRSPLLPVRWWHFIAKGLVPWINITESPFPPDALDEESRFLQSRQSFVPRRVVDELFELMDENIADAPNIQIPTLVIVALEDHVVDNRAAFDFFEAIGTPPDKKRWLEMPGTAHMIQRDLRWKEVCDITADYADTQTGNAAP